MISLLKGRVQILTKTFLHSCFNTEVKRNKFQTSSGKALRSEPLLGELESPAELLVPSMSIESQVLTAGKLEMLRTLQKKLSVQLRHRKRSSKSWTRRQRRRSKKQRRRLKG
jgi:hypothetical protein